MSSPVFSDGRIAISDRHLRSDFTNVLQDLLLTSGHTAGFLHDLTTLITARVCGDGARISGAISLLRDRRGTTVAASISAAQALDEAQNRFPVSPCMAALEQHTVIRVGDVRTDLRWPEYHAAVAAQGIRSLLALPFDLGDDAQAAMNLYSTAPHDFSPEMVAEISHRVRQASHALRLAVRMARHRDLVRDLRAAMESRTTIDLAVGIIMGQDRCNQEKAVAQLKTASQHRNVALRDVAAELVQNVTRQRTSTHFES